MTDIERDNWFTERLGQPRYAFLASGRALIVAGIAICHCFCVRAAGWITTLGALGLWQQVF
jgi:hypothetical protein